MHTRHPLLARRCWSGTALVTLMLASAAPAFAQAPVAPLPERATALDKRFQPAIDFDTDVCFNVSAIDASGNVSQGTATYATRPPAACRNTNYLRQSDVYARARCNNGYCARVYSYFWQADFSHAYDWESVIVWTTDQGTASKVVGVTRGEHGDWDTRATSGGQLRFVSNSTGEHVKMVYNYETFGFSHLWRFSKTDGGDEPPENGTGQWLLQPVVSWNGYPSTSVRTKLSNYDFKGANFDNKEARFRQRPRRGERKQHRARLQPQCRQRPQLAGLPDRRNDLLIVPAPHGDDGHAGRMPDGVNSLANHSLLLASKSRIRVGLLLTASVCAAAMSFAWRDGASRSSNQDAVTIIDASRSPQARPMPPASSTKVLADPAVPSTDAVVSDLRRAYPLLDHVTLRCSGSDCLLSGIIAPLSEQADLDKRQEMLLGGLAAVLQAEGLRMPERFSLDEVDDNRFHLQARLQRITVARGQND